MYRSAPKEGTLIFGCNSNSLFGKFNSTSVKFSAMNKFSYCVPVHSSKKLMALEGETDTQRLVVSLERMGR